MKNTIKILPIFVLIFFLFSSTILNAKNSKTDSLNYLIKNCNKKDTAYVDMLINYANMHVDTNLDTLLKYAQKAYLISKEINYTKGIALSYRYQGIYYYYNAELDTALFFFNKTLAISKVINFDENATYCYNNIAIIYDVKGNYPKAKQYYKKAIEYAHKVGNNEVMSICYYNLRYVLKAYNEIDSIFEYFMSQIEMCKKTKDTVGLIISYENIGIVYIDTGDTLLANKFYNKALDLSSKIGYKDFITDMYMLEEKFQDKEKYLEALEYHKKELENTKKNNDKVELAQSYRFIANTYENLDSVAQAIKYYKLSLETSHECHFPRSIVIASIELGKLYLEIGELQKSKKYFLDIYNNMNDEAYLYFFDEICENLSLIYEKEKNYSEALKYHKLYKEYSDKIFDEKSIRNITSTEYKHEYAKERELLKLEQQKEKEINQAKLKRQETIKIYLSICIIFLIIIGFVIYKLYRLKDKTNLLLSQKNNDIADRNEELLGLNKQIIDQNNTLEKQHLNITDSIDYARKIQFAVLPNAELMKKYFTNYFVFFSPKDVVSGDFYWCKKINNLSILAVADCTGHGVPGAFMSMLGISLLNQIVIENNELEPGKILNILRDKIKYTLQQSGKTKTQKDGIDISLTVIDNESKALKYSGAFIPLYIVRKTENFNYQYEKNYKILHHNNKYLIEIKADRQPVGIYLEEKPFTTHSLTLQKDDILYSLSDGYIDQYDEKNNKKFLAKNFKKLLLSINEQSMPKQKEIIRDKFVNWKKLTEQTDDVLVVGIKI